MRHKIFLLALALAPSALRAQYDFQFGVSPETMGTKISSVPAALAIDPYAGTLSHELLESKTTGYWEAIGISSGSAERELNQYLRQGYGRTELVTLLLIAEEAKQNLATALKTREKGTRLRAMAIENKLDYDSIQTKAKAIRDKCLEAIRVKKLDNTAHGTESAPLSSSTTIRNAP